MKVDCLQINLNAILLGTDPLNTTKISLWKQISDSFCELKSFRISSLCLFPGSK